MLTTSEHQPWIGDRYGEGIVGQRIAIMGYSHWDDAADTADKTIDTLAAVVSNEGGAAFFSAIRNYFGFSAHRAFWPKVLFFNYLASNIGDGAARYGNADDAKYALAEKRFTRIVREHQPDKLFVFTKKVWERLPSGSTPQGPLDPTSRYEWISYQSPPLAVVLLRHPQGASFAEMSKAVQLGMKIPLRR